ncbi:hypothetical protein [Bosea sp. 124]|uniref:hypothetical protein n=1 Tax=Bosea sp. 124 TaxID=2135642 RepID=UPI000D4996BD|nr:hypothetical protein [Bosea sp. 124]PTM41715.1 hypothetical protein C8D03_3285 [Bosea sp. 124]
MSIRYFGLYGLAIEASLDLPELSQLSGPCGRDCIRVGLGQVPSDLANGTEMASWIVISPQACLYRFEGIASFLVDRGKSVTIQLEPGAEEADMRAFLYGVALGTLAHQRRMIPIHISAISTPGGVWAFTGASGAGKSTLVTSLSRQTGWPVLCDDVAVLDPADQQPLLHVGMHRVKLWQDSIDLLGVGESEARQDSFREGKFHVSLPQIFTHEPLPLQHMIQIAWGDPVALTDLQHSLRFEAMMNAIYRPYLVSMFGHLPGVIAHLGTVANQVSCHALTRPKSTSAQAEVLEILSTRLLR